MQGRVVTETRTLVYPKGFINPEDLIDFFAIPGFTESWSELGLLDQDRQALEILLMIDPNGGKIVRNCGGFRKLCFVPPSDEDEKDQERRCFVVGYAYSECDNAIMLINVDSADAKPNASAEEKKVLKLLIRQAWDRFLAAERTHV